MNLRETILAGDRTLQEVPLPKLGVTAFVGALSVAKVNEIKAIPIDEGQLAIVAEAARDESGEPLFTRADVDALAKSDYQTIETLALAAAKKIGLFSQEEEEAAVKNSEPTTPGDSTAE